jgi:O-antigen/teichoic acid export membrane protein
MISVLRLFINQFAAQVITRLLRFSYVFVLALVLAPKDMAVYTIGLAQIGTYLGYSEFGQRILLASRIHKINKYANALLSNSFTITLVVHFSFFLIFLLTSLLFANNLAEMTAFISLSIVVVARGLALWVRKVLIAIHESQELPRLALIGRSFELVVGLSLILMGRGLIELCILHSISWSIEAVWSIRLLIIKYAARIKIGFQGRIAKSILRQSPIYGLIGGTQLLAVNMNTFYMGSQKFDPVDIASVAMSTQVLILILSVPVTFGMSITGLLHGRSELKVQTTHVDLTLRLAFLLSVLFILLGMPIIQLLLEWVYSSKYPKISTYFGILAWSLPAYSGLLLIQQVLISLRKSILALGATAIAVIFYVLLCFMLQKPKPEVIAWAFVCGSYAGLAAGLSAVFFARSMASIFTLIGGLGLPIGAVGAFHALTPFAPIWIVHLGLAAALLLTCSLTKFLNIGLLLKTVFNQAQIFLKQ